MTYKWLVATQDVTLPRGGRGEELIERAFSLPYSDKKA